MSNSTAKPNPQTELRLLAADKVRLQLDPFKRLQLEIGFEERHRPVRPVRALPLTQPDRFISFQDETGAEVGVLDDMNQLDPESRQVLQAALDLYYLKPRVTAIHHARARHGIITWELETNLGPRTIYVRDRQNIRPLPDGRTILTDIYQAKYEVPPLDELDERSRHWLEIES